MLTRNRVTHHESGTVERNKPDRSQRPRCAAPQTGGTFSKEPRHRKTSSERGINISGVDFWHAVEFSRNERFLRTHPQRQSPRLSSGRFPSVLRFRLYQTLSGPIPSRSGCHHGCWAVPTSETLAESLAPKLIGVACFRSGFLISQTRMKTSRRQAADR